MGCLFSRNAPRRRPQFHGVRVIHMNGDVEVFDPPVTTAEIVGQPPKHVLCSTDHLVAFGSNPLRANDPLDPGRLYFLLPHSVFQAQSSPIDLAALMRRLTATSSTGDRRDGRLPRPVAAAELPPRVLGGPRLLVGPTGSRTSPWRPELDPIEERSMRRDAFRESTRSSQSELDAAETDNMKRRRGCFFS